MNILVVDEDPATLETSVARTGSGQYFLSAGFECRKRPGAVSPDSCRVLFLSGMHLPDMSGLELMDRMLATDPGACIVLMSSDYSTDAAMARCGVERAIFWPSRWIQPS